MSDIEKGEPSKRMDLDMDHIEESFKLKDMEIARLTVELENMKADRDSWIVLTEDAQDMAIKAHMENSKLTDMELFYKAELEHREEELAANQADNDALKPLLEEAKADAAQMRVAFSTQVETDKKWKEMCIQSDAENSRLRDALFKWEDKSDILVFLLRNHQSLEEEHSGDCTHECHSCRRCQAEEMLAHYKALGEIIIDRINKKLDEEALAPPPKEEKLK